MTIESNGLILKPLTLNELKEYSNNSRLVNGVYNIEEFKISNTQIRAIKIKIDKMMKVDKKKLKKN